MAPPTGRNWLLLLPQAARQPACTPAQRALRTVWPQAPTGIVHPTRSGGRGAGSDREQQLEHPLRTVVHHVVPGVPLVVGPRRVGGNTLGG